MKTLLIFLFNLLSITRVFAQSDSLELPPESIDTSIETYNTAWCCESMPEYVGGAEKMLTFIKENIRRESGIAANGKVYVEFMINRDGKVENPRVVKGIDNETNSEAIRIVKLLKFIPGLSNGKPVNVKFSLPINFDLNAYKDLLKQNKKHYR